MDKLDRDMFALTSSNYAIWKPRMEQLLHSAQLYDPIKGYEAKPSDMSDKKWVLLGQRTVSLILQWVDDSVFNLVSVETNAHSLWMQLESLFASKTHVKKVNLIRELVDLRYKDGDCMDKHLTDFQNIVNELNSLEIVLPDELQACLFLATLPSDGKGLVISCDSDELQLSMDMIKVHITERHGSSEAGNSQGSGSLNKSRKSVVTCDQCGKKGHMKKDCETILKREQSGNGDEKKGEGEDSVKSMDLDGNAARLKEDKYLLKYSWFFSTRYAFHFCSNRYWFDTFQESRGEFVTLLNGEKLEVEGIGNVKVKMYDGKIRTFGDVRYVPKHISNAISVGRLFSLGTSSCTAGHHGMWEVREGDVVMMKGDATELGLYKLIGRTVVPGFGGMEYIL